MAKRSVLNSLFNFRVNIGNARYILDIGEYSEDCLRALIKALKLDRAGRIAVLKRYLILKVKPLDRYG